MTWRGIQRTVFNLPPAVVAALLLWCQPFAIAQQPASLSNRLAVRWDANSETDIAGYVITLQSPEGSLTNMVKASETRFEFEPLPTLALPWTLTVQAANTAGFVSDPSEPLVISAPMRPGALRIEVAVTVSVTQEAQRAAIVGGTVAGAMTKGQTTDATTGRTLVEP